MLLLVLVILEVLKKLKHEYFIILMQVAIIFMMLSSKEDLLHEENHHALVINYLSLVFLGTTLSKMIQNMLPHVSRFLMPIFFLCVFVSSIHRILGWQNIKKHIYTFLYFLFVLIWVKVLDSIDLKLQTLKKDHEKKILTNF